MSAAPFSNQTKEEKERRREFENTIGNLLVAEYQTHRLRERVKNAIGSDGVLISEFIFRMGDEWFRVNISAEKQLIEPQQTEEPKKQLPVKTKKRTTGFAPGSEDDALYEAWFQEQEEDVGAP